MVQCEMNIIITTESRRLLDKICLAIKLNYIISCFLFLLSSKQQIEKEDKYNALMMKREKRYLREDVLEGYQKDIIF